ncbi:MAG: iron ABC transporter permease [Flavipsychrobacter sp.]|nr:iron ABC transporter permease [Flavipsychrobacter sp.]
MQQKNPNRVSVILLAILLITILLSVGMGAVTIAPMQTIAILAKQAGMAMHASFTSEQEAVLTIIRLPRVLMAVLTGATLAIAGATIQGLFRNPLADPALIGISSGASVAAVVFIVCGHHLLAHLPNIISMYALSLATFVGAFLATLVVYKLSQVNGKTIVSTMLLAGIAINAITGAVTGMFTFAANDAQLRSITFWALGSLGGATWRTLSAVLPFMCIPLLVLPAMSKSLNAFALGEANAQHLGIDTERTKRIIVLLTALCVGASVSVTGVIGFVGLVVPHIIRAITGPDHRYLLILSALAGAVLVVVADLLARTLFAPAELPIGIITAIIGAPFFLYLLLKDRKFQRV